MSGKNSSFDWRVERSLVLAGPRTGILFFYPADGRFCYVTGVGKARLCADSMIMELGSRTGRLSKGVNLRRPEKPGTLRFICVFNR